MLEPGAETPAPLRLPGLTRRIAREVRWSPKPLRRPANCSNAERTDTEETVAEWAKRLPYSDVRRLAHAIDTGEPVTVEYVAASGNRTVRTLSRLLLDPPYLEAWCHLRDDERVFTLSRIHSVMCLTPEWQAGQGGINHEPGTNTKGPAHSPWASRG
ncbi:WYL domain-containing protein [Streptomyces sp. NPDC088817]|uniref:WYL domain-containing protein n=1 Tax=unclassified Streptomyces TaxID=2593676 RepID=UPI003805ED36